MLVCIWMQRKMCNMMKRGLAVSRNLDGKSWGAWFLFDLVGLKIGERSSILFYCKNKSIQLALTELNYMREKDRITILYHMTTKIRPSILSISRVDLTSNFFAGNFLAIKGWRNFVDEFLHVMLEGEKGKREE